MSRQHNKKEMWIRSRRWYLSSESNGFLIRARVCEKILSEYLIFQEPKNDPFNFTQRKMQEHLINLHAHILRINYFWPISGCRMHIFVVAILFFFSSVQRAELRSFTNLAIIKSQNGLALQ